MTPNEATIVSGIGSAIIAAIVSSLVARYTVKSGPNYEAQLRHLRDEIGRVSTAQEGMLSLQKEVAADERKRHEDAAWKPASAFLENNPRDRTNKLIVKDDREFTLTQATVHSKSGAQVFKIALTPSLTKGFSLQIPHEACLALVNDDPDYTMNSKTVGKLVCVLRPKGGEPIQLDLIFRAIMAVSGSNGWIRLEG